MRKRAMAAQFTEVTFEDMEKFLKRGWRALRPKQGNYKGEICFDLHLSPNVAVRVLTSIGVRGGAAADVGQDAIRVTLFMPKGNRPMLTGKWPTVRRTQGWRGNLQDRIEDMIQTYEEREGYFEGRAGGEPRNLPLPLADYDPELEMVNEEIESRERQKREEELRREREQQERQAPRPNQGPVKATFTRYNGDWALRILGPASPGDQAIATRADGRSQSLTVGRILWKGRDNRTGEFVTLAEISRGSRSASEDLEEDFGSGSYERV